MRVRGVWGLESKTAISLAQLSRPPTSLSIGFWGPPSLKNVANGDTILIGLTGNPGCASGALGSDIEVGIQMSGAGLDYIVEAKAELDGDSGADSVSSPVMLNGPRAGTNFVFLTTVIDEFGSVEFYANGEPVPFATLEVCSHS